MENKNRKIIVARHGETDANADGDKIRGWRDHNLNLKGIKDAYDLAQRLKDEQSFDIIITSDLKRASDTASIISKVMDKPIEGSTKFLRPWNLGELQGQESKKVFPQIENYATKNPEVNVPGGESFNDFKDRFFTGLEAILKQFPNKVILLVAHHRNNVLMDAWGKKGYPANHAIDITAFLQKGIPPADFKVYNIT